MTAGTNAAARQLVAQGKTGNLFSLAEHLRARFLPAAPGQAENIEGNQPSSTQTVAESNTGQVAPGPLGLDRPLDRHADKPRSSQQRCVLTDAGMKLNVLHEQRQTINQTKEK
jgi:hypothetical protein